MKSIIFWAISQHEKWMLCYNERYPLTCGCFISLLIWIRKLTGASASIYKPLMVHTFVISAVIVSPMAYKIPDFWYPLCMGNGMVCNDKGHPLLLECFITFLGLISKMRWVSDIIYKLLVVHMVSFLPRLTLKFYTNFQISGILSAWERGWSATRRDTHCCWIAS